MHKLRKRFTNGGFQMAATIKDVAKKANVSISTVSRVLSNQMHVSSSTYKRIQDAVAELNYIPNSSAVSLVKKSSTTVLYADSFYKGRPYENPHMFDIISGSSHELRKKGYFLGLLDLDCSKEKAEEQIINAIQSKKAVFVRTADEGDFFMPERDQVSDCQIGRQRMIGVNPRQHGVERGF